MKSIVNRFLNFVVESFLYLSTVIAFLWLAKFSGIKWTADEFIPSFWTTILTITKAWGPLFVPAASVIFVVKMLQTNVAHEVCTMLEPRLHAIVSRSMSENLDKRIADKALLAIRSVYRGMRSYAGDNNNFEHMYRKSSCDFRDAAGLPNIEIPAHP
ncbi:MAG: hypothetical protein AB7T49_06685 [Oligoflexales bacterium]